MKNNIWYLTKQRFSTLFFHTGRIITFSVFTAVFIVINLISLIIMNTDMEQWLSNVLIICASAVAGIMMVVLTLSIFHGEQKNNQINLELRQGYKPREIYLVRIFETVFIIALFMIIALIVNLITISAKGKMDSVMWYHMFVTSLGWYALVVIVASAMTIFFTSFLASGWAGTLGTLILLIVIVLGGVINGVVQIYDHDGRKEDDYAADLISKKIDSEAINFAMNDLGIYSKQQWKEEVQDKFLDVIYQDNGGYDEYGQQESNSSDTKNNDLGKIKNLYNEKFKDYQIYYNMISGDWRSIPNEVNSNGDSKVEIERGMGSYDFDNIFASFAALGNYILNVPFADNEPIGKFFADSKKFFSTNNFSNVKFDDIENWDMLSGKEGKTSTDNYSWINGEPRKYMIANAPSNKISRENFIGIMKSVSNSDLANKYSFLKNIANFSDDSVLTSMYNSNDDIWDAGLDLNNVELNKKLYPTYAVGGNALKEANLQNEIKNLGISPAELIFNRNVMYFVSKAFDDMEDKATRVPGQTDIDTDSNELLLSDDGYVYMRVNNLENKRNNDGSITYKTGLQYGKLPKTFDEALTITQCIVKYNDDESIYNYDDTNKLTITNLELVNEDEEGDRVHPFTWWRDNTYSNNIYGTYIKGKINGELIYHGNGNNGDDSRLYLVSENKNFKVINSKNYDSYFSKYTIDQNPWVEKENNKTTLSAIKYDSDNGKISFALWNEGKDPEKDIAENVLVKNSEGKIIDLNGLLVNKDTGEYEQFVGKNLKIKVEFTDDDALNTKLVDGTLFRLSFAYKDSETHKAAISWVYNPMTQLAAMFNGVNYRNETLDNLMNSYLNTYFVGINNLNVQVENIPDSTRMNQGTISFKRSTKVEALYFYYVVIESLFVFAGYWMYRKKIVS